MSVEIITKQDLEEFKQELLEEIKNIAQPKLQKKQWLRSREVCKLLNISNATLQNFRINGILPYKKLSGILFYDYQHIEKLLESK